MQLPAFVPVTTWDEGGAGSQPELRACAAHDTRGIVTLWVMTPSDLSSTERLLYERYGLTLTTDQLAQVLHYKSTKCLLNAVSNEKCPVRTFRVGKHRVADFRDVAEFLDRARLSHLL